MQKASAERDDLLSAERAFYDGQTANLAELSSGILRSALARPTGSAEAIPVTRRRYAWWREVVEDLPVLMRVTPGGQPQRVLEWAALQGNSSFVNVPVVAVSPDEERVAVCVDTEGDERLDVRVLDIATGDWIEDSITGACRGGLAWSADGQALIYLVDDAARRPCEVRVRVLGGEDWIALREPDERFHLTLRASRCGRWVIVRSTSRRAGRGWLLDAADLGRPPCALPLLGEDVTYAVEPVPGCDQAVVLSDHEHTEPAVYLTALPPGPPSTWQLIETADPGLRPLRAHAFREAIALEARRGGQRVLRVLPLGGEHTAYEIVPSEPGATLSLHDTPLPNPEQVVVVEECLTRPPRWRTLTLATGHLGAWRGAAPDQRYVGEVHWVPVGGVQVPVTLTRAVTTALDGSAPALLTGYGAYESVFEPEHEPVVLELLDRGVVHAHVHVRGGGELGRRWYLDGRMHAKENTFGDYLAVADYLADGLVDGSRLVTRGMSAGGLLQAVVLTRRPDRWRAVVAEVPFVDVVSSMLDPAIPLTINEHEEWGDPLDPEQHAWLRAYSPCDTVSDLAAVPCPQLPDLLVTGAVHDDRVLVHEPLIWVSSLRHTRPDWSPRIQFRVELGAGSHDGPSGRVGHLAYEAEIAAWLLARLDTRWSASADGLPSALRAAAASIV